jgi:hypothetical protein
MIQVSLFSNEITPTGDLLDRLAVAFAVDGQELTVVEGDPRFIQVGTLVYSPHYGRLIDFSEDGEEWARYLASAYRNGAVSVHVLETQRHATPGTAAGQYEAAR